MNITDFLLARIEEDEMRANYYGPLAMGTARTLAECAAKRAIMQQAIAASDDRATIVDEYCIGGEGADEAYASDPGLLIIKALAGVYADHPDYQQEWAT